MSIAAKFTEVKKNVLIISTDTKTPALPVYIPSLNLGPNNSIGTALENKQFTKELLKGRMHLHPKSDYLSFMGLTSGEVASFTYKPFEAEQFAQLLQILNNAPYDYIIIDCDTNPIFDSLTLLALETADVVLRTITPDVKGYEFQKAQLGWLKNGDNFHVDRHIKIACPVHDTTPIKEAAALAGGFDFILPYTLEVHNKFSAGELLKSFKELPGQKYEQEISKLYERILKDEA